MAMPTRAIAHHPQNAYFRSVVSAITSCLQALNPQNLDPSHISSAPLTRFSPYLCSELVIEVINKQANPYHALFLLNWVSNPCPNPNNYSHTHQCYVSFTDLLLSHSLFVVGSSLLQNHNRLSDLMASKFITAFGNSGHLKGAIFWFHKAKMIENGKCLFSYNAILNVAMKANLITLAESFFSEMMNSAALKPDSSTYTIMIKGYFKMGMVENARKFFDEITCEPNLVCYNTMINGYCKKGDMDEAITIFYRLMQNRNYLPDTVTHSTLIDGHCKKDEFDEAMKRLDEMELRCCKPNLLTYNAIIYGLCLRGNVDEAKKLMTKVRLNGVNENLATHISIFKGLGCAEKSDEAVEYFRLMIGKGMKLGSKVYGIVINEYCKMRKPNEAIALFKEMQAKGITPGVSSFNVVLRILMEFGTGEHDSAIFLLKQMQGMGCKPNLVSYSTVICGLCRARGRMSDVKELVNDTIHNGIDIDATIYSSLIVGYCKDRNEEMATQVFYETIDKSYVISPESFSVLANQLYEKGKAVEAEKMFEEICVRFSIIDVNSYLEGPRSAVNLIFEERLTKFNHIVNFLPFAPG